MTVKKFAVTPGFEVGGTLFRPEQLAVLGSTVGPDALIEMTTFKQLYVAMDEERISEVQEQLKQVGLEVHPAGFVSKSLITCTFAGVQRMPGWMSPKGLTKRWPIMRCQVRSRLDMRGVR
ncbi:hypothetical protein [Paenibacillus uliginis]|uniref:hypothetical protein n=1 Tax=Paenibacillus uliginis TaxID=683737 RepID=UPI001FCDB707|nr:hypothetical protein [Paenibacillus uliginis]